MFKKAVAVLTLSALAAACGPAPQPPADPVAPPPAVEPAQAAPAPAASPPVVRGESQASAPRQAPPRHREEARDEPPPPVRQVCEDCGVITAVSDERIIGESSGVGALGGAAAGGLAGNQFGHKSGKVLATIGGVVLGGLAGREAEKQIKARVVHHVTVNMDDGSTRNVTVEALSGLAVGSKVRVSGENLSPL